MFGVHINPIWHGDKGCVFIRSFPKGVSVDVKYCRYKTHGYYYDKVETDTRYFLPLEKRISKVRGEDDYFVAENGCLTGFNLEDAKKLKQLYNNLQNAHEIRGEKDVGEKARQDLESIFYNPRTKKKGD